MIDLTKILEEAEDAMIAANVALAAADRRKDDAIRHYNNIRTLIKMQGQRE